MAKDKQRKPATSELGKLSAYVMGVAALLSGSKAREYKSCIFGNKGARPKPGHIARCNRQFFGTSLMGPGGPRGKARGGGAHSSGGGGQAKIAGAGPGQSSGAGGPKGPRRAREGR